MSAKRPPAISGVSTGRATLVMTVYPSIASTAVGRTMGSLFDCLPDRVLGIRLSHWLILMPLFPLWATIAALEYFRLKVFGMVYCLTNRSVQIRSVRFNHLNREVPLSEIADVVIRQQAGQAFYPAADIELVNKAGETRLVLHGVPRADVFRQSILEARNAHVQVESSLSTIRARHAG
jgi:hypothetical protein